VDKAVVPLLLACALVPRQAAALDDALALRVQSLAAEASQRAAGGLRTEVSVGRLDPRLKLAPCQQVQPYLPTGTRLWGAARVGLRCLDPGVRWNVFLPVTVAVHGPGLVAASALPAGATLTPADVRPAEVNLAGGPSRAIDDPAFAIGRVLARPLSAGEALRTDSLRPRQWFSAGETVRISAGGAGWRIHGEGLALNPGVEGQPVRVRTESGRVVSGLATGERVVEVPL
jgi:flagella basal body P-ring formation protein FlgA